MCHDGIGLIAAVLVEDVGVTLFQSQDNIRGSIPGLTESGVESFKRLPGVVFASDHPGDNIPGCGEKLIGGNTNIQIVLIDQRLQV